MDGGNSPRSPAPKVRRGPGLVAVGIVSLLIVAVGGALADEPPTLRTLARRYVDPAALFQPAEIDNGDDLRLARMVVPAKTFVVPPESPPPIQFALDEPPAFVTGGAPQKRYTATLSAAALNAVIDNAMIENAAIENAAIDNAAIDNAAIGRAAIDRAAVQSAAAADGPADGSPASPPAAQRPAPACSPPITRGPANGDVAAASKKKPPVAEAHQPKPAQPMVRFADSEPPAFIMMGVSSPKPITASPAAGNPARTAAPAQVSVRAQTVVSAPVPAPVAAPAQAVVSAPVSAPVAARLTAPVTAPAQITVSAPAQARVATPVQTMVSAPAHEPALVPAQAPVEPPARVYTVAPVPAPAAIVVAPAEVPSFTIPLPPTFVALPPERAASLPEPVALQPAPVVSPSEITVSQPELSIRQPEFVATPPQPVAAPPALVATVIPDTASPIPDTPAFSSTAEPLAITIGAVATADQPPPAPGVDGSTAAAQSGAPGSFGEVEKLGDAPPSNTLEFLRSQALLLKRGQSQFDWGLNYTVFDVREALPTVDAHGNIVGVANERERLQLLTIPFAWRYGVCDGLQFYVNAPLGWSNAESTSDTGDSHTNNFVSLGDISAGFNWQIMKGCGAYKPDVIASLGFIAPTGHATFATSLLAPSSALGQGFWDITCSVLAVHTIDPVVFYYGGGYVHRFDANFGNNLEVSPGQEFDYLFGVGFAVNPWVTLSGTFIGNYLTRFGVNDVSIPGSDIDLLRFRVSVTIVKDKRICEPFGEIGMTPDSPSRIGVTFTY